MNSITDQETDEPFWTTLMSHNSYIKNTSLSDFQAPSFKTLKIGDVIKIKTFSLENDFIFNVLTKKTLTRVEKNEISPLVIERKKSYIGLVLDKQSFMNNIKNKNEEIIKVMMLIDNNGYFVYINSNTCWFNGLIIQKFNQ
jgi:hypothetical protein